MPGAGPQVGLGPVYLPASSKLRIKVQSGLPSSSVSGHIWGDISVIAGGDDLSTAPPQSSGSVAQFSQSILLGTISDSAGAGTLKTFQLPPGAQSIDMLVDFNGANIVPNQISVTGTTTNDLLLTLLSPLSSGFYVCPVDTSMDAAVQIFLLSPGGGTSKIWISAALVARITDVRAPNGLATDIRKVGGSVVQPALHAAVPVFVPPWDWHQSGLFNNTTATLTAAASPGQSPVLGSYTIRVANNAATAYGSDLQFVDSFPTELWRDGVDIPAVINSQDRSNQSGLYAKGGLGLSLTMKLLTVVPAGVFVDMSMGGWYV
jgi:hypothetical protein